MRTSGSAGIASLGRLGLFGLALLVIPQSACPPPPLPTITFGQTATASSADNASSNYVFTTQALGNNVKTLASVRVEDATPVPGNPGSWRIELRLGTTLIATQDPPATPGDPTVMKDIDFSTGNPPEGGTGYGITVVEVSGPVPRSFKLTMSPRYETPIAASFGSTSSLLLQPGEFETFSVSVGAGQVGRTDVFLREPGSIGGSNIVTVLDTDHVTTKASVTGNNDVSVDNSEQDDLAFNNPGDYLVIVRNTDATATGTYNLVVGPAPNADQPSACETVTAPGFGAPITLAGKALAPEADRDCYQFALGFGVTDIGFGLDESTSTPGSNEVRVFKDGALVTAKKGNTDINGTAPVDADAGATYQVEVNNLLDGAPVYSLQLSLVGACVGTSCVLTPGSEAALDYSLENPATRQIRQTPDGVTPLPTDAIASFEYDKTSGSTFDFRIVGNTLSGPAFLCGTPISGPSDLFVENCALTTTDGLPYATAQRTSGTGTTGTIRMGPNLRPKLQSPIAIAPPSPVDGTITDFGDASVYSFALAADAQVGIGFDDQGIGSGINVVSVCAAADAEGCLTGTVTPLLRYTGSADGGVPTKVLAAGSYVLIVDNSGVGSGDYSVCVGPAGADDPEPPISITTDLAPGAPIGAGGGLTCGDTDRLPLTTTVTQPVKITVAEAGSLTGNIVATLQKEDPPASGTWVDVATDQGGSSANFNATLNAGTSYRLVIDNSSVGSGGYGITIGDPNG
jgi:hypothetical protein